MKLVNYYMRIYKCCHLLRETFAGSWLRNLPAAGSYHRRLIIILPDHRIILHPRILKPIPLARIRLSRLSRTPCNQCGQSPPPNCSRYPQPTPADPPGTTPPLPTAYPAPGPRQPRGAWPAQVPRRQVPRAIEVEQRDRARAVVHRPGRRSPSVTPIRRSSASYVYCANTDSTPPPPDPPPPGGCGNHKCRSSRRPWRYPSW